MTTVRLWPEGRTQRRRAGRALALTLLGITSLLEPRRAAAVDTGYQTATVLVNAGGCWVGSFTLANVNASDNAWASCAAAANGRVSDFGFAIPGAATVVGLSAEIEGNDGAGGTVNYVVELSPDNGGSWFQKAGSFTGSGDTTTVLGGPADTWGRAWTVAETTDANFDLRIRRTAGGTLRVDRIRVAIEYTLPPPDLTQGHYRWRLDDGTQLTANWAAPEDTKLVAVPRMTLRRLRFEVSNEGVGSTSGLVEYQLQVAQSDTCATASYQAPPIDYLPGPGDWEIADTVNFGDQDPTTNVAGGVTDEAGTFITGRMKDAGTYTVGGIVLDGNQFTEIEFAVRAKASAVTGANYCFRLYDYTNNRVLDTYSSYAQATVASGNPLRVRTGVYVGDGSSPRAIAVGFKPDVVIVKGNLDEYAVIRTATMPGTASHSIFWDLSDPQTDAIRSLDASGFSVGADTQVNSTGVTYYWTAFEAGSGEMAIGTYDGNDADNRAITGLGFQPEYVLVMSAGTGWPIHKFSAHAAGASMTVEGGARTDEIQNFLADGFELGTGSEVNDATPLTRYHWLAFNHVPGRVHIASYTGNGGPSQAITAPGFTPEYTLLTRDASSPARQKPASIGATSNLSHPWGGYPGATNETDVIQTVLPTGFQAGPSDDSNLAGTNYYYMAIAAVRLEQVHTRWRNDDGSEAAATWAMPEDSAIPGLGTGQTLRLRLEVSNEGGLASDPTAYALQVAEATTCSAGVYTTIPAAAGGHWRIVDSASLTDAAATTNVASGLTDEGASFVPGQVKDAGNTTGTITLGVGQFTELEFALQATTSATPGGTYCFRLYDATAGRALDAYAYAEARLATLTLANHPSGQIGDQFASATPVTATLFQFRLTRSGTVTIDTLRARFTTTGGVASGDVTAGELWEDTNGNGVFDGAGPDTLLQGAIAGSGGALTFTSNFSPNVSGRNYFVRATVANLVGNDTTTFSLGAADIDTVEAGIGEPGAIANATHTADFAGGTGGDVYYSVGTSTADLKTGAPTITISNGTATLSVSQTGYIGVGDEITYNGATRAYVKSVLGPAVFVVHTATGAQPPNVTAQTLNTIRRAFNSLNVAVTGAIAASSNATHLNTSNLVTGNFRLYWVVYNDAPLDVTATTAITGYTTDATRYITLTAAGAADTVLGASHRHDGTAGSGAMIRAQASGMSEIVSVTQPFTRIEWLEIDGRSFVSQDGILVMSASVLLRNLIVHDIGANDSTNCANGTNTCSGIVLTGGATSAQVRNSFVYDTGQDGITTGAAGVTIANTTIFRSKQTGEGLQVTGGTITAENVIAMGFSPDFCAQDFCTGMLLCNHCISSGDSADNFGGVGNQVNRVATSQFMSTTAGAVNLHLLPGADAMSAGKDLSGSFSDDIDGQTRVVPWEVGADERAGAPNGQMLVRSGVYTGNATDDRPIFVGFQPDVVIVKRNTGSGNDQYHAAIRTSTMPGDATKDLDSSGLTFFAGGVKSLTATGFVLGTDPRVNSSNTYYWIAFKAAPGELKVGTYTGDGNDNRSVTGVGFRPDYVITLPAAAQLPLLRLSSMPADACYNSDSFQYANRIQREEADGFQVGNDNSVNQNGATYHYVAWNTTPGRVAVGSYVGNGALLSGTTQQITVGFTPEWAVVKHGGPNQRPWVHKPASSGVNTNFSTYLTDWAGIGDDIQFLQPLGFQVIAQGEAADDRVNQTGVTYYYAAFGPHPSTVNYRSIGTAADYNTGTVTATAGSNAVTGTGAWLAANRGRGDVIVIPCPNPPTCTGGTAYQVETLTSNTELTLSTAFAGASGPGLSYLMRRQHATLLSWYECLSNQAACAYFDAPTASLVADDRREIGVAYDETAFTLGATLSMANATTDPAHDIVLTADPGNRHAGTAGTGVVVNAPAGSPAFLVRDNDVTLEWLEIAGGGRGIDVQSPFTGLGRLVVRYSLLHDSTTDAIRFIGAQDAHIYDNFIYGGNEDGIDLGGFSSRAKVYNNTIQGLSANGITGCTNPDSLFRNNLVVGNATGDIACTNRDPGSSHNLTTNATSGPNNSPAGGGIGGLTLTTNPTTCATPPCVALVNVTPGAENLHLVSTSYANAAVDAGTSLQAVFTRDIDNQTRAATWDVGADERDAATAVTLVGLAARPFAAAVRVEWETASELDNLGFHLYRAQDANGPWTRLTASLVKGLGSSPFGRGYSWLDAGLTNGVRYFYRLEDVDTRAKATSHGPVSAVPDALLSDPTEGRRDASDGGGDAEQGEAPACPAWVMAAHADTAPSDASAPLRCSRHGDPESVGLDTLQRGARGALVELRTGGFYAVHQGDGSVRLFVAGFDTPDDPNAPALPLRRALIEAVAGRGIELAHVEARDLAAFRGLRPAAVGAAEIERSAAGALRAARRALRPARLPRGYVPSEVAALAGPVFQGATKHAALELTPLRYDGARGELVLARRVRVRLSFAGRDLSETARGRKPRKPKPEPPAPFELLAQLHTTRRGLHAASFEQLFPAGRAPVALAELGLRLQGDAAPFHVEPRGAAFGPGSVLYFHAGRVAASTDYASEIAWELVRAPDALPGTPASAAPGAGAAGPATLSARFESDKMYVPGLVGAPDVWLWDGCASGGAVSKSFALPGLDTTTAEPAALTLHLQGASESGQPVDHHLRVSLGGVPLGDVRFAGKRAFEATLPVPAGLLQEVANTLELLNVPDTGVTSAVYLDRFQVDHAQVAALRQGQFEGRFSTSGAVTLQGASGPVALLDVTEQPARFLTGFELAPPALRFQAEAGRVYLAVASEGLIAPRVAAPAASTLRGAANQADFLLIAPAALVEAVKPLVERRQAQGLAARAVAFEEIASVFGHGRPSAEAVREFLAFAFHSWSRPAPRYALLVGDSSYDPRNFTGIARPAPLPALQSQSSYMLTVSDQALAAVNGDDALPDLAIGRLSAGTPDEARLLVAKLLAWEDSGQGLTGGVTLVADNADVGGDFEANARDLALSFFAGRAPSLLFVSELGGGTRAAIRDAFDAGQSLVSYVGHGSSMIWATENVWNSRDVLSLRAQSRQPLLLTLNCLNGYFVHPTLDSLAESLVKADGRGAIAGFAPSGLSHDSPAHQYHRALLGEITSGRHERLGDAIAAAQRTYAATGLMPELLGLYQLFGDPTLKIR